MQIVVSNRNRRIRLPIPTGLVFNRFVAGFAPRYLKEQGVEITKQQAVAFIKELNRYRHKHPEWILLEVQSSDGKYIKIKL